MERKNMKKTLVLCLSLVMVATLWVSVAFAKNAYLNDVNSTCGTSYGCGLCHIDPKGGGPLTADGDAYVASGYSACYFCSSVCNNPPACTDADVDIYAVEGGDCGAVDCNDNDAAVNPGAVEACADNMDNDCDGKVDCADANCSGDPACAGVCIPTAANERNKCTDGIDNDCDGALDCSDSDCSKNRVCK
jgi:hypothetical protein